MLEKLTEMEQKIRTNCWKQSDMQEFMDRWAKHIMYFDRVFNDFQKENPPDSDQLMDKQYVLPRSYASASVTLS